MSVTNKKTPRGPLLEEAEISLRQAVGKAIAEHKRLGVPMAFLRDGKIVEISAEEAEAEYLVKKAEYEAAHPPLPKGRGSDS